MRHSVIVIALTATFSTAAARGNPLKEIGCEDSCGKSPIAGGRAAREMPLAG